MIYRHRNYSDEALEKLFAMLGSSVTSLLVEEIIEIASFLPIIGIPANDRQHELVSWSKIWP